MKQLGLQKAKPVTTPAVRRSSSEVEEDRHSPKLSSADTSLFRSVTMRAVYLAQDRQDIAEATKNLSREMKEPSDASMRDLKRLGRYLKHRPDWSRSSRRSVCPRLSEPMETVTTPGV